MVSPEQQARAEIDRLLAAAGWQVQHLKAADLHAARGVALREFELNPGFGTADYLLYVDGKACGVIEAKKQGATLTGVEAQSGRYAQGLPAGLPAWRRPLPFVYESTGVETHFTNGLDPAPRARPVFAFHRPETLAQWLTQAAADPPATVLTTDGQPPLAEAQRPPRAGGTMLARLQAMPLLVTEWGDFKLWPAQITAIRNLERWACGEPPKKKGADRGADRAETQAVADDAGQAPAHAKDDVDALSGHWRVPRRCDQSRPGLGVARQVSAQPDEAQARA